MPTPSIRRLVLYIAPIVALAWSGVIAAAVEPPVLTVLAGSDASGQQARPLNAGDTLRTGDGIRIQVRSPVRAYVYVVALGASGSAVLLQPFSRSPEQALMASQMRRSIPSGGQVLPLDRHTGTETLIAIATPTPLRNLDDLVLHVEARAAGGGILDEQALSRFGAATVFSFRHQPRAQGADTAEARDVAEPRDKPVLFANSPTETGVLSGAGSRIQALLAGTPVKPLGGSSRPLVPVPVAPEPAPKPASLAVASGVGATPAEPQPRAPVIDVPPRRADPAQARPDAAPDAPVASSTPPPGRNTVPAATPSAELAAASDSVGSAATRDPSQARSQGWFGNLFGSDRPDADGSTARPAANVPQDPTVRPSPTAAAAIGVQQDPLGGVDREAVVASREAPDATPRPTLQPDPQPAPEPTAQVVPQRQPQTAVQPESRNEPAEPESGNDSNWLTSLFVGGGAAAEARQAEAGSPAPAPEAGPDPEDDGVASVGATEPQALTRPLDLGRDEPLRAFPEPQSPVPAPERGPGPGESVAGASISDAGPAAADEAPPRFVPEAQPPLRTPVPEPAGDTPREPSPAAIAAAVPAPDPVPAAAQAPAAQDSSGSSAAGQTAGAAGLFGALASFFAAPAGDAAATATGSGAAATNAVAEGISEPSEPPPASSAADDASARDIAPPSDPVAEERPQQPPPVRQTVEKAPPVSVSQAADNGAPVVSRATAQVPRPSPAVRAERVAVQAPPLQPPAPVLERRPDGSQYAENEQQVAVARPVPPPVAAQPPVRPTPAPPATAEVRRDDAVTEPTPTQEVVRTAPAPAAPDKPLAVAQAPAQSSAPPARSGGLFGQIASFFGASASDEQPDTDTAEVPAPQNQPEAQADERSAQTPVQVADAAVVVVTPPAKPSVPPPLPSTRAEGPVQLPQITSEPLKVRPPDRSAVARAAPEPKASDDVLSAAGSRIAALLGFGSDTQTERETAPTAEPEVQTAESEAIPAPLVVQNETSADDAPVSLMPASPVSGAEPLVASATRTAGAGAVSGAEGSAAEAAAPALNVAPVQSVAPARPQVESAARPRSESPAASEPRPAPVAAVASPATVVENAEQVVASIPERPAIRVVAEPKLAPLALTPDQAIAELDPSTDQGPPAALMLVVTPASTGSALLVDDQGHLLTAWHVVRGFSTVTVWPKAPGRAGPDGTRPLLARIVRANRHTDLALLVIEGDTPDIEPVVLAEQPALKRGQVVHLLGHQGGDRWAHVMARFERRKARHSWLTRGRFVHRADVLSSRASGGLPDADGGALFDNNMQLVGLNVQVGRRGGRVYAVAVDTIRRFLSGELAPDPAPEG